MRNISAQEAKNEGWDIKKYYQYKKNYKAWANACYQLLVARYGKDCIIYDIVASLQEEYQFNARTAERALEAMEVYGLVEHQSNGYAL